MGLRLKQLFGGRMAKFYLLLLALFLGSIGLFYLIANLRGAAAWERALERLEREGETFTYQDLFEDPVADADNFFGTPALLDLAMVDGGYPDSGPHAELRRRLEKLDPGGDSSALRERSPYRVKYGIRTAVAVDFRQWNAFVEAEGTLVLGGKGSDAPARRFLDGLEMAHGSLFEVLALAARRPESQLTPHPSERLEFQDPLFSGIPHNLGLRSLANLSRLRAAAASQIGDGDRAAESILVIQRIAEGYRSEPGLISFVLAEAMQWIAYEAIWDGIDCGVFSEAALLEIEGRIARIDFLQSKLRAARYEAIITQEMIDHVEEERGDVSDFIGAGSPAMFAAQLAPGGWFDQNRAQAANWSLDYTIIPSRDASPFDALDRAEDLKLKIDFVLTRDDLWEYPHQILAAGLMRGWDSVTRRAFYYEAMRDLVLTACRLERFKLVAGEYPDRLVTLAPAFCEAVPIDPCSVDGHVLGYRREGDRYKLWSIGLDSRDDSGALPVKPDSVTSSRYRGDWVWRFGGELPPERKPSPRKRRTRRTPGP